jgi:uncharacterized protein YjbI with pentapeptide repeats
MHRRRKLYVHENRPLAVSTFASMLSAHEDLIAGRRGGARLIARFVIAQSRRCDLRKLADSDFTGADLSGSTFVGADLQRASLYCANLTRCDFRGARLNRADLRGGKFYGAQLAGAVLDEADMRAAILCVADDILGLKWIGGAAQVKGASLNDVNLDEAEAFAVDFSNCSLRGAKLRSANLKNAIFTNANLDGADLSGARLEGANFRNAILTGIDVEHLGLPATALAGCVRDPSPDAWARLDQILDQVAQGEAWVTSNGKHGSSTVLDGFDLRPAAGAFTGKRLVGLSARDAVAVRVDFSGAELPGANFDDADLRGASFKGADLRGASFRRANLAHAIFEEADTSALPLRDGRARPVQLDGAILDGSGLRRLGL